MLAILQNKVREVGLENVDIVQAGFLTYEHRRRPADFLYSRFALHHLPDFWKSIALQRLRRIEHSTFTWLLEPMLERSGFRIEEAEYSPDGIFARYVARAV